MNSIVNRQLSERIADFFDTPLVAAFGTTPDGREVVYPWPWQHKGYVVPDRETAQKLRATMQWWVRMALPVFLMLAIFGIVPLLGFGVLYLMTYYATIWFHVNRLAPVAGRIKRLAPDEDRASA